MYTCGAPSLCFRDLASSVCYTLSLHDALPISITPDFAHFEIKSGASGHSGDTVINLIFPCAAACHSQNISQSGDRKSTRLNSSHVAISYAVFSLKKKKKLQK